MRIEAYALGLGMVLLAGNGCIKRSSNVVNYTSRTELLAIDESGNETSVPVSNVSADGGISTKIVVSPDKKHAAYARWENAHYVIYVADLPGATSERKVAEQMIPEGSGSLNTESLIWLDEPARLQYQESGVACGETGNPSIDNSSKDCDGSIVLTYTVNIETGAKTLTDKWMEKMIPLQP